MSETVLSQGKLKTTNWCESSLLQEPLSPISLKSSPEPRRRPTKARTEHESSVNKITEHNAEVRVRRYGDISECDVVVAFHGQEMSIRCRDYHQAVKWARIECKSYKIDGGFTVEG
jgi:hypothetical protein